MFAALASFALAACWREDPEGFASAYVDFLAIGGSQPPADQLAALGVDVRKPDAWDAGFGELERIVGLAEQATSDDGVRVKAFTGAFAATPVHCPARRVPCARSRAGASLLGDRSTQRVATRERTRTRTRRRRRPEQGGAQPMRVYGRSRRPAAAACCSCPPR